MAFMLFVGSVYLMLSFVFGKWMGYLVLAVCFAGWLIIHSSLWYFGFWAQGPGTPTNQGPRGAEPAWVVVEGGLAASDDDVHRLSPTIRPLRGRCPTRRQDGSVESVSSAATSFLAAQANEQLGSDPLAPRRDPGTQFTVDGVRFAPAEDDKTSLAVVQAHYSGGGPLTTLALYHDSGQRPALLDHVHDRVDRCCSCYISRCSTAPRRSAKSSSPGAARPPGTDRRRQVKEGRETTMIGAETVPLLDQGSIQFMLFGVMVLVVLFLLWITIAK